MLSDQVINDFQSNGIRKQPSEVQMRNVKSHPEYDNLTTISNTKVSFSRDHLGRRIISGDGSEF